MVIRVLPIEDCNSDGDSSKWPTADRGLTRNDTYFLERIANDFWARDKSRAELGGHYSIATWRLDKLPAGYAGFEKPRPNSKHVDRYLYGHPRGQFRSLAEFYPHFKHLMDSGGPIGCQCKICTGNKRASTGGATSGSNGTRSVSPARRSSHFPPPQPEPAKSKPVPPLFDQAKHPNGTTQLPQGRLSSASPPAAPRKQADEDGSPDVFRALIDELKAAHEDVVIDRKIKEFMSPDWRVGNDPLEDLLDDWRNLPRFTPRTGELVLFVHDLKPDEGLAWDDDTHTWLKVVLDTGELLDRPQWEAGVVTQMPLQRVDDRDLSTMPDAKSTVANSGFRIEPISKPGNVSKSESKQHRYLPLHGIRPLIFWQDCLRDLPEDEWHPTVKHALTATNTFCVIGRNRFKGVRDEVSGAEATVFCHGAYIGADLVLTGDAVRLLPDPDEQRPDDVTDILVVTSIKLRLVNIDAAGSDDWDRGRPYTTCLHISGRAFTLDKRRSFDGVGKLPIPPNSFQLPVGLKGYGQWYHMTDPKHTKSRLEVPFTRILGRAPESIALETWFKTTPSTEPGQIQPFRNPIKTADFKRGLSSLVCARSFAYSEDPRIDKIAGKSWFWADTRTEALDLHEVNGRFVGHKDDNRTRAQMESWQKALRALDGSKKGLADYHAERKRREEEKSKTALAKAAAGSYGMVGAAVTLPDATSGSGTEAEALLTGPDEDQDHDMVDVDVDEDDDEDEDDKMQQSPAQTVSGGKRANVDGVIELSDDELVGSD